MGAEAAGGAGDNGDVVHGSEPYVSRRAHPMASDRVFLSARLMDPLADVLDLARVRGALLASVRASAPWGLALPQGDGASFHAVTSGTAWMCVPEHEPIQLMPGDLVLLPTGAPHTMSSELSVECPPYVKTPGELAIGGTGAVTTLACAGYSYDLEVAPRLMSLLPTVLHVRADPADGRDVAAIVELLAREVGGGGAGSRTAVARLIDLLLIVAIRAWQPEAPSWLAGLHDPVVARALALLHERPGEPWTLEALAREVHLSRATLARALRARRSASRRWPISRAGGWTSPRAGCGSSLGPDRDDRARGRLQLGVRVQPRVRAPSRGAARPLPSRYPACAMADTLKIIVLEGDETGQELLEQSVRVLDAELLGHRPRARLLRPLAREAARDGQRDRPRGGARDARGRLRAEGRDGHARGQGRRRLAQPDPPRGGRRQGDRAHRAADPGRRGPGLGRLSPDLASSGWPSTTPTAPSSGARARATTRSRSSRRRSRAPPAARSPSTPSAPPSGSAARRSTAGRSGRSRRSTRGCSRRRWTPPPRAIPSVHYQPVLIDALYAGLISGAADSPLVIPALNRDGDCLSDLVLPMFGSIAGAESVLLGFDEDYGVEVAMAEAPHGTAPSLMGKNLANPMAMLLACGSVLSYAATKGYAGAERASRAVYESVLEATASGTKTVDLGGHATTSEFTDAVVERVRTKLEVWSTLGTR